MQTGNTYQVVPELRQMVVFAQHNVISDAPFTRVDLITCRNLLIYLQPPAQQRVLSFFHFALTQAACCSSARPRASVRSRTDSRSSTSTGSCIGKAARFERRWTRGSGRRVAVNTRLAVSVDAAAGQALPRAAAVGLRRAARRDDAAQPAAERSWRTGARVRRRRALPAGA